MLFDCMGKEVRVGDRVAYAASSSRRGEYLQIYRVDEVAKVGNHSYAALRVEWTDKNGVLKVTTNHVDQDQASERLLRF